MMNYQKLVEIAKDDLANTPKLADACESIIRVISEKDPSFFRHMTFASIHNLSGKNLENTDVILLTQYLCGDRVKLFNAGFEYITNEESFILDKDNSHYAFAENAIAHPETGDVIYNVKNDVFMFFSLVEHRGCE